MRRHVIIIAAALLISSGVGATVNAVRTDGKGIAWVRPELKPARVSTGDLFLALHQGGVWLVDARPAEQFAEGRLAGAINVPAEDRYEVMGEAASVIPVDGRIICYCGSSECDASDQVAEMMVGLKCEQVQVFKPGWEEIEATPQFSPFIERGASQ